MEPTKLQPTPGRLKTFFKDHTVLALTLLGGLLIIIVLIVVIFTTLNDDDGIEGTNSRPFEASIVEDQKALQSTAAYQISDYLPLTSADPAYTISYQLDRDDAGNYTFCLVLNAFSASARDAMVKRLLSENFGSHDPLDYEIVLENYYNPFSNTSLADLKSANLPANIQKSNLYSFGDSSYTVQTYTHTLYDGSINTYRAVFENNEPKTIPQLFFTYKELDFLDRSTVKSLNSLE